MFNFSTTSFAVGLEVSSNTIRGAAVILSRGKPKVEKIFETPRSQGEDLLLAHKDLLSNEKYLLSTGMKGNEVLVRSLNLPLTKESDIETAVEFQMEPLLPYPLENALLSSSRLAQHAQSTDLTVLSIRKDHLQKHLDALQELNIEPEFVSSVPIALACFSSLFEIPSQPCIVVHLDDTSFTCALAKEGKLLTSYTVNQGTQLLATAYQQDMGEHGTWDGSYDFSTLDAGKMINLNKAVEALRLNATKTIYALSKEIKEASPDTILLAGEGHLLQHLAPLLYGHLNMTIQTPVSSSQADFPPEDLLKFSVPIGLGINALKPTIESINFRQREFNYPHPWKRLKKALGQFALLCLLLAVSFFIFGRSYIAYEEDKAKENYLELLKAMHKSYNSFETEYLTKFPKTNDGSEMTIEPLSALSASDLMDRINYLQKDLKPPVDTFPYYPNVPRVSDVLAWISTHPKVVGEGKSEEGSEFPLIQIDNFSYTMVKHPDQKQRLEKYQVKVELEFSSTTPKAAREFHDALIVPNAIVDPKGEVKWGTNKGKYRTSFYLKDKTLYPTN